MQALLGIIARKQNPYNKLIISVSLNVSGLSNLLIVYNIRYALFWGFDTFIRISKPKFI